MADEILENFEREFEDDDRILNRRPDIKYVEPDQQPLPGEPDLAPAPEVEEAREQTKELIKGYKTLEKMADVAQDRVDKRVAAGGGVTIKLDPIQDAATIEAMKRHFPDKDPTVLDYGCYKKCLNDIAKNSAAIPSVQAADMRAAKANPQKTDFGGLGNTTGQNRANLSSPANVVKPVDLKSFQSSAILALFALLLPMISKTDDARIARHLLETPHKPI